MAQTDYVVKLLGKDELSKVLANIKTNLKDTGAAADRLDEIQKKFKAIAESTATPKKQLRDIQKLLGEMNFEGLNKTELFTQMAEHAGRLKDAISDAGKAVKAFADDQFKLESMAQGFSLITTTASGVISGMKLLGVENENVTKSIKKLQATLTLLNSVQTIANYLNKDSALMLRLKQAQLKGNAAYTNTLTTATTANTVSQTANNAAVTFADKARARLNQTIAIGRALLGDWTGLVVLGAAALTTYAMANSDAKDKVDGLNGTVSDAKEKVQNLNKAILEECDTINREAGAFDKSSQKHKEYSDAVADSAARIIAQFNMLRIEWSNLRTEAEKTEWLEKNQSAFAALGMSIDSVTAAEAVFVNNTGAMVEALTLRAEAAAIQDLMTDVIKKDFKRRNNFSEYKPGQLIDEDDPLWHTLVLSKSNFSQFEAVPFGKNYGFLSKEGALRANGRARTDMDIAYDNEMGPLQERLADINEREKNLNTGDVFKPKSKTTTHTPTASRRYPVYNRNKNEITQKEEEVFNPESIKYAKNMVSDLQKKFERAATDGQRAILKILMQSWQDKIDLMEGKTKEVKIKPVIAEGSLEDLQNQLDDIVKKMTKSNNWEEIDTLRDKYKDLTQRIEDYKIKFGWVEDNTDPFAEQKKTLEEYEERMGKVSDSIGVLGSAFSSLGGAIGGAGGKILQFAGQSSQAIAQLIPEIVKFITAKQAEAMAGVTAAGTQAGFPAMFGVIAAGIATVASIFASLPKFAEGGIVPGGPGIGDRMLIRANAGEMILNQRQQNNLYKAIASNRLGSSAGYGNVRFRISGSDLVGVLDNYNSKISRQS